MSPVILDPLTAAADAAILGPIQRILRGVSATLGYSFTQDGATFDPGTATVSITASDGTIIAANAATTEAVSGVFTYTLTPAQIPQVDRLEVVWSAVVGGQTQRIMEIVEVAGGFVFNVAEARAVPPLNDIVKFPTASIVAMRTTVEQAIEEHYGTALVPRYRRETLSGTDATLLQLTGPVLAIRSITVSGTVLSSTDLAALYLQDSWLSGYSWTRGVGNIVVRYEYGLEDGPPSRIRQDAIRLARQWLVTGPVDDRALGAASPDGTFSFGLATPGRNGSVFGLPDLDSVIMSSPYRVGVA